MKRQSVSPVLLLANAIGATAYVVLASRSWAVPAERGLDSMSGEPFLWALYALPVLALYILVDLGWGIMLMHKRWSGARYLVTAGAIWITALVVDFTHH